MSRFVKILLISGYAFLLLQYLRRSLSLNEEEIDLEYIIQTPRFLKLRENQLKKFRNNFTAYLKSYKRPKRFKTDYKFILKYTNGFLHYGTSLYKNGQRAFIENNCTYYNCYLTNQKNLLNDYRDFDAILFDIENIWDSPLLVRDPYQKFVFIASESAANYPLCNVFYDNYYNLTWTYKLNSDIHWSYMSILDKKGNIVGPKINMTWIDSMEPTPIKVKAKLSGKTKAAAWFVSHCTAASGRANVTKQLEKALNKYNLTVDIYGWCGKLSCPKERIDECLAILESDYYFYLSFENSLSEDYVTEKILYPLQNCAVPIVYGGADYSRFLPPNSYINAAKLKARQIADEMYRAIKNPIIYENYFRWHNYYRYIKSPPVPDICKLCRILNEDSDKHTIYKHFRQWWNPDFPSLCTNGVERKVVMKPGTI